MEDGGQTAEFEQAHETSRCAGQYQVLSATGENRVGLHQDAEGAGVGETNVNDIEDDTLAAVDRGVEQCVEVPAGVNIELTGQRDRDGVVGLDRADREVVERHHASRTSAANAVAATPIGTGAWPPRGTCEN